MILAILVSDSTFYAMIFIPIAIVIFIAWVISKVKDSNEDKERREHTVWEINEARRLIGLQPEDVPNKEDNYLNIHIGALQAAYHKEYQKCMHELALKNGLSKDFENTYSSLGYCAVKDGSLLYRIGYDTTLSPRSQRYNEFFEYYQLPSFSLSKMRTQADELKKIPDYQMSTIPISSIKYYAVEGELQTTTNVSGGGVNVRGAVAGGLLFGGVGAIVGSQVGTQINTKTSTRDNRAIWLCYEREGKEYLENVNSYSPTDTIKKLRELLPQKDYKLYLQKTSSERKPPIKDEKINNYEEIKMLKDLLDSGAITQEEYDAKKRQLLAL